MSLLDDRIKEFDIPAWPYEPYNDQVIVFMIPDAKGSRKTYVEGGVIEMPEAVQSNEQRASARGILLAAGLFAMDCLRGYGIDAGHIIWVSRLSPWRHVVDRTEKGDVELMFMSVGDIKGSEDVLRMRRDGKLTVCIGSDGKHQFKMDGESIPRFDAPSYNA